jgi:DNA repair protein RecO (recombination protein O)
LASLSTDAIVLRAVSYGEADRIVTLLGRETGKVSALARGARKSQRRFPGGLGLCAIGVASLRERPGADLMTLEKIDVVDGHLALGSDVGRMAHAAYVAELAGKLCAPRQAEPAVYDLLVSFLKLLERDGPSAERLRAFEIRLLGGLGFAPVLDSCVSCSGARYAGREGSVAFRWDPERGGAACLPCSRGGRPISGLVLAALGRFARIPLEQAGTIALGADTNRDCREALLEIINQHVSGPLKTVEFIAKVARAGGAS